MKKRKELGTDVYVFLWISGRYFMESFNWFFSDVTVSRRNPGYEALEFDGQIGLEDRVHRGVNLPFFSLSLCPC